MKKIIFILLLLINYCYAQRVRLIVNGHKHTSAPTPVVVAQFNFALDAAAGVTGVAGWVDLIGLPGGTASGHTAAVLSTSDSRSGTAIGINTISTSNWAGISSASNTTANNAWGPTSCNGSCYFGDVALTRGGFGVLGDANYSAGAEHLEFTGLNPAKHYKFEIIGCRSTGNPSRRVVYVLVDNSGTINDTIDVKDNTYKIAGPVETPTDDYSTTRLTNRVPKPDGTIRLFMKRDGSDANNVWAAYISAIRITQLD